MTFRSCCILCCTLWSVHSDSATTMCTNFNQCELFVSMLPPLCSNNMVIINLHLLKLVENILLNASRMLKYLLKELKKQRQLCFQTHVLLNGKVTRMEWEFIIHQKSRLTKIVSLWHSVDKINFSHCRISKLRFGLHS